MRDQRPPAIFLMGPTASGKTALAIHLASLMPCDIISVDSALVFRGMDIGTAKPDLETRRRTPHQLVDIRDPEQHYSAAEFCHDAIAAMESIQANGRIPLLVGGTSLYFRSLQRGLSTLPGAEPELRLRLEAEAQALGWAALHRRLTILDPLAAQRIHPNDPQRIQRALEVIEITGQRLSDLQGHRQSSLPFRLLKLIICPGDRSVLHQRITQRFMAMKASGFLAEVESLMQRPGLTAEHPAMRAVGYRQAWQYLTGDASASEWVEKGIFATRQLAKRQITWLRSEYDAFWRDPADSGMVAQIMQIISHHLGVD